VYEVTNKEEEVYNKKLNRNRSSCIEISGERHIAFIGKDGHVGDTAIKFK